MKKTEFIIMMEQDLHTHPNKDQLMNVLECMKEILKSYPADIEINSEKTVENCFKKMEAHAKQNQKSGCYYFSPKETTEFIKKYLGLQEGSPEIGIVSLEDFL